MISIDQKRTFLKKVVAISTLFFFQFFCSCSPCDSGGGIFEVRYNAISVGAVDTSGFYESDVTSTVHRHSFGLNVNVLSESNQIAWNQSSGFGFNSLSACEPYYEEQYLDPIVSLQIFVQDVDAADEMYDVTTSFGLPNWEGDLESIDDFMNNRSDYDTWFSFELFEYAAVPRKSIFTVKVFLESEIVFVEHTGVIEFVE